MKILVTGDWHLDTHVPQNRIDDYFVAQVAKVNWIFELAEIEGCHYIIQPGDFFNSHRANDYLKQLWISAIDTRLPSTTICTIYGQHDLRYHSSDKDNTPLRVMEVSGSVHIIPNYWDIHGRLALYGCSWGEPIPKDIEYPKDSTFNILVAHIMVIKDKKIWEAQKEFTWGNHLLRRTKFDLIVTGDNHESFVIEGEGHRKLINCGSLMRSTIAQVNHKPVVYIIDTDSKEITTHYIPIRPPQEVLAIDKMKEEEKKNEELDLFIEGLSESPEIKGLNFLENLRTYMEEENIPTNVTEIIEEALNE